MAGRLAKILEVDQGAARAPPDLVLVSGADAALGGAVSACTEMEVSRATSSLAVQRQNEHRVLGDDEIVRRDGDTLRPDLLDLGDEGPGIDNHAVADHGEGLPGRTTPDGNRLSSL